MRLPTAIFPGVICIGQTVTFRDFKVLVFMPDHRYQLTTNNGANQMNTISGAEFQKLENGPCGKFPHTGPVNYESGKNPFTAAFKGMELKRADGKNRCFKTADAAIKAITEAARQADADMLDNFSYVGSRHHY
jgi:hypothetical protein